jgi:hypothetical protein
MSSNPFALSPTRDFAATAPGDLGAPGTRIVARANAVRRYAEDDPQGARQSGQGAAGRRPREERERDALRRALSELILGAFDAPAATEPAPPDDAGTNPAFPGARGARAAAADPRLQPALLEFMYALFHALDQIDDAEPTLEFAAFPQGLANPRSMRSAFGERLELLARRIAVPPPDARADPDPAPAGFEGVDARLARGYVDVLVVLKGAGPWDGPEPQGRARLSALLRRLANAMHSAPTLGCGLTSSVGAMLRVSA